MKDKHQELKDEKKKKKKGQVAEGVVTSCNENSYIVNQNKIREGLGVTKKAKILME